MTKVRKGQAPAKLSRVEFRNRFEQAFCDPAFTNESDALSRIKAVAWDAYSDGRKSPVTCKAGEGYADPDYDLSVDWTETRARLEQAEVTHWISRHA